MSEYTEFDEGILAAHREDVDVLVEMDCECSALRAKYARQSRRLCIYAALCFAVGLVLGLALAWPRAASVGSPGDFAAPDLSSPTSSRR